MRKSGNADKQIVLVAQPSRSGATLAELLLGWIRRPVKVPVKR